MACRYHIIRFSWVIMISICFALNVKGQEIDKAKETDKDTMTNVHVKVDHSNVAHLLKTDDGEIQILVGLVELRQDSIYMYCDSATIIQNKVDASGHVIIQDRDSISAFGNYLYYDGDTKIARLEEEVSFVNDERRLFSPSLIYDLNTKIATYNEGGILFDQGMQLKSKRGSYHTRSSTAFFQDSVIIIHKDFELKSDSIRYDYISNKVFFLGKTLIFQNGANIYCEDGYYLIDEGQALFSKNAQYRSDDRRAVADSILYDRVDGIVTLIGHAEIRGKEKLASADTIIYLEKSQKSDLIGNAFFDDGSSVIQSKRIVHDGISNAVNTQGKTFIREGGNYLESNELHYDDATGLGIAIGDVIWQDTAQGVTIIADIAEYNKREKRIKAYGQTRPLLINKMGNDSMYLSADTLLTFKQIECDTILYKNDMDLITYADTNNIKINGTLHLKGDSVIVDTAQVEKQVIVNLEEAYVHDSIVEIKTDTIQNVLAFANVKIFKSDFQAVCDSLSYDTRDSIFRFYKDPIIWSDTTQLSGDTIYVHTKNNEIESAQLILNGFIISSQDLRFFDQIKGRDVWSFFEDGALDRVRVQGNAESYYYVLDKENAYIGLNKSICSEIIVHFAAQNKIDHIDFLKKPNFNFLPMKDVMAISPKLEGFHWNLSRRPKSIADLAVSDLVKPKNGVKKDISRNLME